MSYPQVLTCLMFRLCNHTHILLDFYVMLLYCNWVPVLSFIRQLFYSVITVLKMHVVVCGAGIIGASVTYYLAKRGVRCTVIERCSPACAASGKAGGFLARDWCDHNELGPLARLGFDLHSTLASELGEVDYRRMDALAVRVREGKCLLFGHYSLVE